MLVVSTGDVAERQSRTVLLSTPTKKNGVAVERLIEWAARIL